MATLYISQQNRSTHIPSTGILCMLIASLLLAHRPLHAQQPEASASMIRALLDDAAARFDVPREALYGIAYNESRWSHVPADSLHHACSGMPHAVGIMGLHDDPYFGHSLRAGIAIGISADEARTSIAKNIEAGAYHLSALFDGNDRSDLRQWLSAIGRYSGIPDSQPALQLLYVDGVLELLRRGWSSGDAYVPAMKVPTIDRASLAKELERMGLSVPPADYSGATWQASPNFSSRGGASITAVTIHDTEGNFAGSLSWLRNSASGASAHYIIRSVDGYTVQMVRESDKAWHVRDENPYTVGIEHEGFVARPEYYTPAMYNASAALTRYLIDRYNIPLSRTRVKGHIDFPNNSHTDPGGWWDWPGYFRLIARKPGSRVVIDPFEDNVVGWWQPSLSGSTVKTDPAGTRFAIAPSASYSGTNGASLSYSFTDGNGGAARYFRSGHGNTNDGLLNVGSSGYVTLAVKGDGSGHTLELWFYDNAKGNRIISAGAIAWNGWRVISLPISALGSGAPFRFHSLVLKQSPAGRRTGSIAVDELAHETIAAGVMGDDLDEEITSRKIALHPSEALPQTLREEGPVRILSILGEEVARFDAIPAQPVGSYLPRGMYLLVFTHTSCMVAVAD